MRTGITPAAQIQAVLAMAALFLTAPMCAEAASPEERGALAVATWDAGTVTLDGASIHVYVHYPTGVAGPMPVAAVVHGASRYAAVMAELSDTLASRGIVALTPTIPCNFAGCDHEANAQQIAALLDWGVARSADASSKIAGLVDGSRRAAVGHSWGGLASFLAAKNRPDIGTVVILDANDDKDEGKTAAPQVTQPSVHVMAEKMGPCNSFNWKETVYPLTPAPHMRVVVTGSAHCDVEDPTDGLCKYACGSGDPATAPLFRRYAVAWLQCLLLGDAAMAPWIGGADLDADVAAGRITLAAFDGLAALPCLGGTLDAGMPVDEGEIDSGLLRDAAAADAGTGAEPSDAGVQDTGEADAGGEDVTAADDTGAGDGATAADAAADATTGRDAGASTDGGAAAGSDAGNGDNASSGCSCAAIRI